MKIKECSMELLLQFCSKIKQSTDNHECSPWKKTLFWNNEAWFLFSSLHRLFVCFIADNMKQFKCWNFQDKNPKIFHSSTRIHLSPSVEIHLEYNWLVHVFERKVVISIPSLFPRTKINVLADYSCSKTMEMQGIDPRTSHMLSERSPIWATSPSASIYYFKIFKTNWRYNEYTIYRRHNN